MLIVAKAGDTDAQYAIANKCWEGVGTPQNRTPGYTWAMVAAHHKNEMAVMTMEFGGMLKYLTTGQITTAKKEFTKILTDKIQSPQCNN